MANAKKVMIGFKTDIVIKDGKLAWIIRDLGELQAYLIVCDKLGVSANPDKIAEIVSDDTE